MSSPLDDTELIVVEVPTQPEIITIGLPGTPGPPGTVTDLEIGTVTTGSPSATITGTAPTKFLNLVLPAASGVPAGGTTGSVLQKVNGTDYNTSWIEATASATASTVVKRDASANITSNRQYASATPPLSSSELTRKDYVDTQVATKANTSHTHTAANISDSTSVGRAVLMATDAAAGRTAISAAASTHTHVATTDLTATGTKDATTFLRGDNTWAAPPGGGGGTVTVANITDATTVGRNVLLAADATAVRTVIGAGTSNLIIGTTSTTAKAGDYSPPAASETVVGIVELATTTEATTGTDTTRAITAAGLKAVGDTKVPTTRTISTTAPLTGGGDLSANRTLAISSASETAVGAVELATSAETITGTSTVLATHPAGVKAVADTKAALSHTHVATTDLTATGTKDSTTFLRGDNTWAAPTGTSAPDASTSVKGIVQLTNHLGGTATSPTVRSASETLTGIVELATTGEAITGTDTTRAVTPAGLLAHTDTIGTSFNTASALVRRSSGGAITSTSINATTGAITTAPSGANDIVRKTELDTKVEAGTGILRIESITQAAYDALGTKVATTLYVIVG